MAYLGLRLSCVVRCATQVLWAALMCAATRVVAAVMIDFSSLMVYGVGVMAAHWYRSLQILTPMLVGTLCAFTGSFMGKRVMQKVTMRVEK